VCVLPWLANYPLHHDEALYGFWARLIASGRDPLLLSAWVDKPPLAIYVLAGSLKLFGISERALRLPGMIAGTLLVPATYILARRAYGPATGLLAAALVTVCPFAILFAPTAFTDPWLTLWLVAAAGAALAGRPFWAGLTLGLAVASKQQGVLVAPLVVGLLALSGQGGKGAEGQRSRGAEEQGSRGAEEQRSRGAEEQDSPLRPCAPAPPRPLARGSHWLSAVLGFAAVLAPLTWWDSLRWATRPSFWDRSLSTYGGLGLAPLTQWPARAAAWSQQLGYLFGLPALSALMLFLAAMVGGRAAWCMTAKRAKGQGGRGAEEQRRRTSLCHRVTVSPCHPSTSSGQALVTASLDLLLSSYVATYLALHFLLTFRPWDRYLLPLVPLVSILAARGLVLFATGVIDPSGFGHATNEIAAVNVMPADTRNPKGLARAIFRTVALMAVGAGLALLLGYAAWLGAAGRLPVGSDHGAYAGLDQVATIMRGQPANAVIYHHALGWHFDFYLFDAPQERRWYDTAAKLAADASRTTQTEPDRPQWLTLPTWEEATAGDLRTALAGRGLALAERERIYRPDGNRSFTVYQIVPTRKTYAQ
jgi:hypothetical protein